MATPRTAMIGVPLVMTRNVIYALPVRNPYGMFVSDPSADIDVCNTYDGTFESITVAADGQCFADAAFIRCTSVGGCTLMCKVQ